MEYLWRLATAMFILLAGIALGVMAWVCQGMTVLLAIGFYGMMLLVPWGIIKGFYVIWDYHKHQNRE